MTKTRHLKTLLAAIKDRRNQTPNNQLDSCASSQGNAIPFALMSNNISPRSYSSSLGKDNITACQKKICTNRGIFLTVSTSPVDDL